MQNRSFHWLCGFRGSTVLAVAWMTSGSGLQGLADKRIGFHWLIDTENIRIDTAVFFTRYGRFFFTRYGRFFHPVRPFFSPRFSPSPVFTISHTLHPPPPPTPERDLIPPQRFHTTGKHSAPASYPRGPPGVGWTRREFDKMSIVNSKIRASIDLPHVAFIQM